MSVIFGKEFVWGVSTAAYQIEGAVADDGRGPSIWDAFSHTPGKVMRGETGDVACDHYHRYMEDCDLMQQLGVDAYRFSTSWSRIVPDGAGPVNPRGLDFYDRLVDALLEREITPWLCLYHWDLPQALQERGGWANRDCANRFADYAAIVSRQFADRVTHFVTFNEPNVFVLAGYAAGLHAPGIADLPTALKAAHTVNLAHGHAVSVVRSTAPGSKLGVVVNQQPARAASTSEADEAAAALYDQMWNRAFADPMILGHYPDSLHPMFAPFIEDGDMKEIAQPSDFLGVNHYAPQYVRSDPATPGGIARTEPPRGTERTMMGWEIAPDVFRDTLISEHERYRLPVYVTENGMASEDTLAADGSVEDDLRISYLERYTAAVAEAREAGADIRGYFVWSLLDNFEWAEGYRPRFGLIHTNYTTLKRTPKASFDWLRNRIAAARSETR
jgi:beta-glucosidase